MSKLRNGVLQTWVVAAALAVCLAVELLGQSITIPNTFVNGTTADANQVNADFAALAANALNRNAGTMLGLLTSQDIIPDANATRDLGSTGTRFRDLWLGRNLAVTGTLGVTGATTLTSTSLSVGGAAYTFPGAVGAAGSLLRASNGSGTLAWSTTGWTQVTTTSVGTQNNFDPGIVGNTVVWLNNASLLTVTGFSPAVAPVDGQQLLLYTTGAGQVDLAYNSGSSNAGVRLINFATSGATSLAPGSVAPGGAALYVFNASLANWRLVYHEQGAVITRTFAAGNYTASAGTWTVASAGRDGYILRGRMLYFHFSVSGTTSGTPVSVKILVPGGFSAGSVGVDALPAYNSSNGSGASSSGYVQTSDATHYGVQQNGNTAFGAGTVSVIGEIGVEVQ